MTSSLLLILFFLEPRVLSETAPLPPKVGIRSAYTLPSPDPTYGITLGMLLYLMEAF